MSSFFFGGGAAAASSSSQQPQLRSWASGLSQLWHGADQQEQQEQEATAAALERRRKWTRDYAARALQVWDLVRKLRVAGACPKDGKNTLWPSEEWRESELGVLFGGGSAHTTKKVESRDVRRFERRLRSLTKDVDARYPGLLSEKSTVAFVDETPDLAAPEEAPQMVKDLARETVVVCGSERSPGSGANSHYEAVHMAIVQGLLDAGTATETAVALASAAILATWRTRVGADAWDRAEKLNAAIKQRRKNQLDDSNYALVSRPTEPFTVVDVARDRVVVTAHSHLSEVRIVEPDDDRSARCGDERAFFALTSRVTVGVRSSSSSSDVFFENDDDVPARVASSIDDDDDANVPDDPLKTRLPSVPPVALVARRCVLAVVLVADDASLTADSQQNGVSTTRDAAPSPRKDESDEPRSARLDAQQAAIDSTNDFT